MENKNLIYSERIVAVLYKDGVYNGIEYHNYNLVTIVYENNIPVSCDCKSYKFNQKDIKSVTGFDCPEMLIGCYIKQPYFNKFGKLVGLDYETGVDDE